MPYFEIIGVGFATSTDKTDHRVLWVSAPSQTDLVRAIADCPHEGYCTLDGLEGVTKALDYALPSDTMALRAQLRSYARPEGEHASLESQLVDLLLTLLRCPDLQLEGLEDDTVEAMFNANLFLTTHFPEVRK